MPDQIEKNADNLCEQYTKKLDDIRNKNGGFGSAVKNAENGMQVEKCAEIVTLQILKSDKGRSLLYAMKVDAEPENDIYKELVEQTTKYFLNKRTFNLKAGEDIADKAQRIVADPKTRSNVLKNIIENEKRKQAAKVTKKQVNLNVQKGTIK